jgi:hypothetical protein
MVGGPPGSCEQLSETKFRGYSPRSAQGREHASGDALSRRPYPKAWTHCQKVKQQSGCRKARLITIAAMDSWNHSALRREQLCDVGPNQQEMETEECPKWKNITDSSPTYKSYWAQ